MGSTGSDKFTDYSGSKKSRRGGGGSSGEDPCTKIFTANLEDVERCPYYQQYKTSPAVNSPVKVVLSGRPAIETTSGELIGYLPTEFNYLAGCLSSGRLYAGFVTAVSSIPVTTVRVDISPL